MSVPDNIRKQLVDCLMPFMDESQREGYITLKSNRISDKIRWGGATNVFTQRLVDTLDNVKLEDGTPLFYELLKEIIDSLGYIEEDHCLHQLLEIFKLREPLEPPPPPGNDIEHLHSFELGYHPTWIIFDSNSETLHVSNYERIESYTLDQSNPINSITLEDKPWKLLYNRLWRDAIIASDWYGNVVLYPNDNYPVIKTLKDTTQGYDHLPFHRFAIVDETRLFGASWDASIVVWTYQDELQIDHIARLDALPLHLIPISRNALAICDQKRRLNIYETLDDSKWEQVAVWQSPEPIRDAWLATTNRNSKPDIIVLDTANNLYQLDANGTLIGKTSPGKSIAVISHLADIQNGRSLLLYDDQTAQWLSWNPFRLLSDPRIQLDFMPRQIHAIHGKTPTVPRAIGLSPEGDLFMIELHHVEYIPTGISFDHIIVDQPGHFVFGIVDNKIAAYSILGGQTCSVKIASTESHLQVERSEQLSVALENNGNVVLRSIDARLTSNATLDGNVENSLRELKLNPGETVSLNFYFVINVAGAHVPMWLELDLYSTIGQSASITVPFHVKVED